MVNDLGLAGIFLLMLAESACIPIPSEATMLFAGFGVAQGHHTLIEITAAGVLGNLVGSWIAYGVGYYGRMELVERHGRKLHIKPEHVAWADRWFSRYGEATVFFTRLLPIIRTFISLPAGVARMPFVRFTVFTLLGCIPWVLLLGFIGQQVGHNWTQWKDAIGYFDYVIVAAVLGLIAYAIFRRRARRAAGVEDERPVYASRQGADPALEADGGGVAEQPRNSGSAPVARVPGEGHGD